MSDPSRRKSGANPNPMQLQRYDVANHLRTPGEALAYLKACVAESGGDRSFVIKALTDIGRAWALRGGVRMCLIT